MLCRVHGAWYSAQAASIDVLCSPSEYLVQAHVEAGMRPTRTAIVRNAVPRPSIAVPSRPAADDRTRFLYLGQLSSHKGVHTLIEAIGLASPANFRIDIAGRGDAEGAVAKLAARDGRVHYHGFVDGERKKRLLASADVLIFPSVWVENAPMSIAEAFCNGLAVIGSKLGAIPEFVADGVNGMLFGPGNAAALALRMMHLVERPADLRRLKDGARSQGEAWPTPQAMALAYTQIYRSVLRSRAAPSTAEPAGMSTLRSILGETR
jgi:glycosyltransferase involved in cell wall biosynthesis